MTDDLMNATICDEVVIGSCVMLVDDRIVYAGPIKGALGNTAGKLVLLNTADFDKLKAVVDRGKH